MKPKESRGQNKLFLKGFYVKLLGTSGVIWAIGSAVERFPDKKEVDGSTPSSPTLAFRRTSSPTSEHI